MRHGRFTDRQEKMHQQRYDEQRERQRSRKQKMLSEYANARKAADALFSRAVHSVDKPGPVRYGDNPKEK
jgi:hypothetical protein